ncbi:MAG: SUMF1/EgtB/PvdO family nonheme iron enzyme [Vicinamibacterales bacterium]
MPTSVRDLDRPSLIDRFRAARRRTRALFDLLSPSVLYDRPIALRNPVLFYEGHMPAFAVNTLAKRALGHQGVDAHFETIFARGIDPDAEAEAVARGNPAWPARAAVQAYADEADALVESLLRDAPLDDPRRSPLLDRGQAAWAILEHEEMHQETLAYIWHEVPHAAKTAPAGYDTYPRSHEVAPPAPRLVRIPAGTATLGTAAAAPFAWDNERPEHLVRVDGFAIDEHNVTNADFLAFVEAGGYTDARWWRPIDFAWVRAGAVAHPHFWAREDGAWFWRGMFERVPLPLAWPVYVTWAEATAYARWRGHRLPTEPEFHRAAYGSPDGHERPHPWGTAAPDVSRANCDFRRWDPEPVGVRPAGVSAFGVHDLVGNGWEWTSTPFGPFEGFTPLPSYPEYSADFFDGDHYVMKGASPATPATLVRRGFRNWFRPRYPHMYATFRCVEVS